MRTVQVGLSCQCGRQAQLLLPWTKLAPLPPAWHSYWGSWSSQRPDYESIMNVWICINFQSMSALSGAEDLMLIVCVIQENQRWTSHTYTHIIQTYNRMPKGTLCVSLQPQLTLNIMERLLMTGMRPVTCTNTMRHVVMYSGLRCWGLTKALTDSLFLTASSHSNCISATSCSTL